MSSLTFGAQGVWGSQSSLLPRVAAGRSWPRTFFDGRSAGAVHDVHGGLLGGDVFIYAVVKEPSPDTLGRSACW